MSESLPCPELNEQFTALKFVDVPHENNLCTGWELIMDNVEAPDANMNIEASVLHPNMIMIEQPSIKHSARKYWKRIEKMEELFQEDIGAIRENERAHRTAVQKERSGRHKKWTLLVFASDVLISTDIFNKPDTKGSPIIDAIAIPTKVPNYELSKELVFPRSIVQMKWRVSVKTRETQHGPLSRGKGNLARLAAKLGSTKIEDPEPDDDDESMFY